MKRCIYYICSASNLVDWGKNLLNITQVYGVISLQLLAQCISIESRYNFCVKGARMAKIDESDSLSNRTGFQRRYIYSKLLNLRLRKFALNFHDIFHWKSHASRAPSDSFSNATNIFFFRNVYFPISAGPTWFTTFANLVRTIPQRQLPANLLKFVAIWYKFSLGMCGWF